MIAINSRNSLLSPTVTPDQNQYKPHCYWRNHSAYWPTFPLPSMQTSYQKKPVDLSADRQWKTLMLL